MARKKKDSNKPIATLIENPFQLNTEEVVEAQLIENEELLLDRDLEESPLETDSASESLNEQLDKLAHAISQQASQEEEQFQFKDTTDETNTDDPAELALQIAEDQALQQEFLSDEPEAAEVENESDQFPSETQSFLDLEELQSCIEAILFISDKPLPNARLHELLGPNLPTTQFDEALQLLRLRYQSTHHGIELVEVAGGHQFRTKLGRADLAKKLVRVQTQRLSTGAMETLAIIAYKQPSMKEDIDKIRGVDSSYFVRTLLERKLIHISGRSELPGRPILYETTAEFLEVFGLKDLSAMPSLREIEQMIPSSETRNPEDEDPKIREMRRLVNEMKTDRTSILNYDPKEDEKILKEIRETVNAIPTSTPYLEELRAAEALAEQQAKEPVTESASASESETR